MSLTRNVYAIRDCKTGFQDQLMLFDNDDAAKRWFYQVIHDTMDSEVLRNSPLACYPQDFVLVGVGWFDLVDGKLTNDDCPTIVCSADSLAKGV